MILLALSSFLNVFQNIEKRHRTYHFSTILNHSFVSSYQKHGLSIDSKRNFLKMVEKRSIFPKSIIYANLIAASTEGYCISSERMIRQ
ncbi:hypothetical protein PFISCL1PPCAC_16986 [Pristionchus fissidentatus]|uniref:Uncharacterized protein n=1 Tax=Pristionchus fissidentatus TaxID=1538716 RepID=A0AAV5W747_9BILA|nr:hypothetical protein PFISCL1PPCAC_16986 [Pristionchus fissidentatus]